MTQFASGNYRWRGSVGHSLFSEVSKVPDPNMRIFVLPILLAATLSLSSGCVYRANISQGNLIEKEDLEQLAVGMTHSQVRFLLGTPMVDDPFHKDRWDYVYFLKVGRKDATFKRWVSVFFTDDKVSDIRRDQELSPDL